MWFGFVGRYEQRIAFFALEMMDVGLLFSHSQCTGTWKRRNGVKTRVMRIVALRAAQLFAVAGFRVPEPECLSVDTAFPLSENRTVTLGAEQGDLGESNRISTVRDQFVPVCFVVAIHAAGVQAVFQTYVLVLMEVFGSRLRVDNGMTIHAGPLETVDDGLWRVG